MGDPLLPPVRVKGYMNFACFLPPNDAGLPAIDGKALVILANC